MMRIAPPTKAIHLRKSGALLSSQPVAPARSMNGDSAVPRPNKIDRSKLSIGLANAREYKRRATNAGHTTKPLDSPSEKARMSNFFMVLVDRYLSESSNLHLLDLLLRIICAPIIMVTIPNAIEEYA